MDGNKTMFSLSTIGRRSQKKKTETPTMHFSLKQLAVAAFYATNLGSAYVIPQFFQEAFQQEEPIENYLPQLNDDDSSAVAANIPKPHIPYFMKPHVEVKNCKIKSKLTI